MWLECEKQSSDEDPFICCVSFIKLPKGSSSSLANLVVSQTWQKLRQAWRGLTTQAHMSQKSCLIAAGLKHGPKQVVYRDVDTQRDGSVQAPKRWDLAWEGHRWKNVLRSFALDCLWKKNACPLAAMLITLLWRASTHCHFPAQDNLLPRGFSQLSSSVRSPLCPLLQDRRTNLIFPLLSEGESPTITCGNLEVMPLVAWKARLHFGYVEPLRWRVFPYNAGRLSPDMDGAWQISGA